MPIYLMKQPPDPALEKQHQVRVALCSGIPPQLHAGFEERWNTPWREAYGLTETGCDLIMPLDSAGMAGSGAMGRLVPGKEARVVDLDGQAVADGEVGELVIRGKPMMLGYWNNPEATARTIRDGWLHTGDLVRRDREGYFYMVGRLKDMIRRGGENIAASEVEYTLCEHPAVNLTAVVAVPDELRGEEVKAYIQLKPGETVEPQALVAFVRERLAAFKAPRYLQFVDELPLTPSGKVAKTQLQARLGVDNRVYDALQQVWQK
jgi:crotonobetaine/carnitine-CoA ligase